MKILAAVYNPIQYDGRVQRESQAEAAIADVTVVCPAVSGAEPPSLPGTTVLAVPLPNERRLFLRHAIFWLQVCRAVFRLKPDIIHAHDFFMALPGLIAARFTGARLVYDAHELIIPEPGIPMSRRNRFWYRLERLAIRSADLVIAANEDRARIMVEHYGLKVMPLVIRNIPPMPASVLSDTEVLDRYPMLKRTSPNDRICVYQGDINLERGIGHYVDAMKHLPANYRLILIGDGPDREALARQAAAPAFGGRVVLTGKVPKAHLYDMLRQCDVGIITYPNQGLLNLYCAPNKLYEYAQAGLIVVCSKNPTLDRYLREHPIGLCCEIMDIPGTIQQLIDSKSQYAMSLPEFLKAYDWQIEAAKLSHALTLFSSFPIMP